MQKKSINLKITPPAYLIIILNDYFYVSGKILLIGFTKGMTTIRKTDFIYFL